MENGEEPQTEQLAAWRRVGATFAIPTTVGDLLPSLATSIQSASPIYARLGSALEGNIDGLLETIAIPYIQASSAVADSIFHRHLASESIRSRIEAMLSDDPETSSAEYARVQALKRARIATTDFIRSDEGREESQDIIVSNLDSALSIPPGPRPYNELIRQGVVLCWSAFEVFCRDIFVTYLNETPEYALRLWHDPTVRKRFDGLKFSLETLAEYDFDLSSRLGSFLSRHQDLSDPFSIKSLFLALFPDGEDIRMRLSSEQIRLLSLQRNLIVHRRGIVDDEYRTKSGSPQEVGSVLIVQPSALERFATAVAEAGVSILGNMPQRG